MSFRSSTRTSLKKEYSDNIDSATRRENFNRIRNIFEIRRPSKSPNSTLRKSKSSSSINLISSDDERDFRRESSYSRTNSSCYSSTLSERYKRRSGQTTKRKEERKIISLSPGSDIQQNSHDENEKFHDIHFTSYKETIESDNGEYRVDEKTNNNETDEDFEIINFERKYIKNNSNTMGSQNSLGRRNKLTKEIMSRKQRKEVRESIKNFLDADSEGETENYRKSLVEELDFEVAKMKSDGFLDEDDSNTNTEEKISENTDVNPARQDISRHSNDIFLFDERHCSNYSKYKQLFEGMFNELDRRIQLVQHDCKREIDAQLYKAGENKNPRDANQESCEIEHKITVETEDEDNCESVLSNKDYDEINNDTELNTDKGKETTIYMNIETDADSLKNVVKEQNHSDVEYDEVYVENDEPEYSNVASSSTEDGAFGESVTKVASESDVEYDEVYNENNELTNSIVHKSHPEDDVFGSLGDDLENGSYFVEAYNIPGKELVIVEISLERRTVNLDKPFSLDSIEKSMSGVDMVFHKKADKSLNIIEDPKEFINQNASLLSNGYHDPESNRSTVYSTTSRESDVFDTDDEGIEMGNIERKTAVDENSYNNVRRETFCDDKGIVRIERVGYPETAYFGEDGREPQTPVSRNNSFAQKGKLSYIIDEIKSTERKYVEDLQKVVKRYIPYIDRHTPSNLYGRQHLIFGNIQTLLEHQKKFLAALENCGEEVEDVVKTFTDFKALFKLYPRYFKNKPKADTILREFSSVIRKAQDRFKERLDLSSYLLTPLQRLGKYKLFLENIEKQLQKLDLPTENALVALDIIKTEMSKGNDFVAIESIENSPVLKTDYGSFKMREIFSIVRPRRVESMVFLFENVIVFTTLSNHKNSEIYNYHDSIKMNDLRIATFEDFTIHLTDFTKGKKVSRADRFTYVLEAKSEKIKDIWRKAIEDILWQQLYKVKENTLKFYQTHGNKKSKIPRTRAKSTGFSVFYCD